MQTAMPGHKFIAGTQIKMIGVAENYRCADGRKVVRGDGLHRTYGSYRHENGRLYIPMRRVHDARARRAVLMLQSIGGCHARRVAG